MKQQSTRVPIANPDATPNVPTLKTVGMVLGKLASTFVILLPSIFALLAILSHVYRIHFQTSETPTAPRASPEPTYPHVRPWEMLRDPLRFVQRLRNDPQDTKVVFPQTHDWSCPLNHTEELPKLYLLSGFIASGKSTFAKNAERTQGAVTFSPDEWILGLYGKDFPVSRFQDVGDFIKELIWLSAREVLGKWRKSVVLDFSLWTKSDRNWWRQRVQQDASTWYSHCASTTHPPMSVELVYIDCPIDVARERLIKRNNGIVRLRQHSQSNRIAEDTIIDPETASDSSVGTTDGVSLYVPLQLFDEWRQYLEPPQVTEEFPVTFLTCKID